MVNGFVNKGDGNFEIEFKFANFEAQKVTIGSYPSNDHDINQLRGVGCTSLLDIQSFYRSIPFKDIA